MSDNNRNTGNCNTGYWNTGNCNTGYRNTGYRNTGYRNTGDWNTGNCNTGYRNTGYRNTGDWNTGYWNTGNCNTGAFNRDSPQTIRVFEKDCNREEWNNSDKPSFLYFNLTEFIWSEDMTDEEKESNPSHETTKGYLKSYGYQEAFKKSWDEADEEDRAKLFKLPNFDAEIFKDISGIDVAEETDPKKKEIESIRKEMDELSKRMKELEK